MFCYSLHSSDRPDNQDVSGCCKLLHRVRKETEADRRRTVLRLFVGMIGATIKRWQVCSMLRTQDKHGMCGVPCAVCNVRPW